MQLEFVISVSVAGFFASYLLIIFALWAHRLGLPKLDFSKAMANLTFGESYKDNPPYGLGVAQIFLNGIFFALVYAALIGPLLPGPLFVRGIVWGVFLFAASGLFYVPVFLREGFFLNKIHPRAWITSLMVHAIYGGILGWLSPIL